MLKEFFDKLIFKPDPVRLYSSGITDVGQRRDHNEDSYLIDEKLGLFIVADGMGGHEAGEVASKLAVETIFNHIKKLAAQYQKNSKKNEISVSESISSLIQDAIEDANNQTHCYNIAKGIGEGKGMGTTLTGFLISSLGSPGEKQLYSFNVGDSRTYCFSHGKLKQLTIDHSHYQLWIETGKEGPPPKHNIIYKAVGPWRRIVADQNTLPVKTGELYLLCSDGLNGMISDEKMGKTLRRGKLSTVPTRLVAAANQNGGDDNITVLVIQYGKTVRKDRRNSSARAGGARRSSKKRK